MGRGRQKAKQTKLAREVKYSTSAMDVESLRRELTNGQSSNGRSTERHDDSDDDDR